MGTLFGKPTESVGSSSSLLLLKNNGSVKILWGNKFIDLVKNGKLNLTIPNVINLVDNEEEISLDGIYFIKSSNEVMISVGENKITLSGETDTSYVSYLIPQKEVTLELKLTALKNIGFYYKTLEEAKLDNIQSGILFILSENKLYIAKEGQLIEYNTLSNSSENILEKLTNKLVLEDFTIKVSDENVVFSYRDEPYITLTSGGIIFNKKLILDNGIESKGAEINRGYKIYEENGRSILEIDSIIWRNIYKELPLLGLRLSSQLTIFDNYLTAVNTEFNEDKSGLFIHVECETYLANQYKVGDFVYILLPISPRVFYLEQKLEENITELTFLLSKAQNKEIIVEANYLIGGNTDKLTVTIGAGVSSASTTVSGENFSLISYRVISGNAVTELEEDKLGLYKCEIVISEFNKVILNVPEEDYYRFISSCNRAPSVKANQSLVIIDSDSIDILDSENKIRTIIGRVKEENILELLQCNKEESVPEEGIYSDNFIGLNPKLYDTVFKKRCDYPKYDKNILIPDNYQGDEYNLVVPTIGWIKLLLQTIPVSGGVPRGSIIMYNGQSPIPSGWAICDGNNGTPNLIGKFIKAVSTSSEVGDNESDLDENNEIVLSREYLPKHNHPHTHNIEGTLSGTIGNSGNLSIPFERTDYNYGISSTPRTVVTAVSGGLVRPTTETINEITNINSFGGSVIGGDHSHSITINKDISLSSEIILEEEWQNKSLKIEPRSYSLIFIMKL